MLYKILSDLRTKKYPGRQKFTEERRLKTGGTAGQAVLTDRYKHDKITAQHLSAWTREAENKSEKPGHSVSERDGNAGSRKGRERTDDS